MDIDFASGGGIDELCSQDQVSGGVFHRSGSGGALAGVAPLSGSFASLGILTNGVAAKRALNPVEKSVAMDGSVQPAPSVSADYFELISLAAVDIAAGDSVQVAIAFIGSHDESAFAHAASGARHDWEILASSGGGQPTPQSFVLDQNYPNPFNAGTLIPLRIEQDAQIRLDIVNILGQKVRTLSDEHLAPGAYAFVWDGQDQSGNAMPSGIYLARLRINGETQSVRKMALLK